MKQEEFDSRTFIIFYQPMLCEGRNIEEHGFRVQLCAGDSIISIYLSIILRTKVPKNTYSSSSPRGGRRGGKVHNTTNNQTTVKHETE